MRVRATLSLDVFKKPLPPSPPHFTHHISHLLTWSCTSLLLTIRTVTYDSEELRRLFAPMEPQTFFSMHFQKQHIHLQRNNRTYFADLAVPDVEQFISKLGRRKDVYIAAPPKPMHNDPDGPGGPGEQQQGSGGGGGGDGLPEEVSVVQLAHDTIRMRSATAVPFLLDLEQLQDGEITKLIDSGGTVTIILEEFVGETREAFERTHPALAKFESSLNSLFGVYATHSRTLSHCSTFS